MEQGTKTEKIIPAISASDSFSTIAALLISMKTVDAYYYAPSIVRQEFMGQKKLSRHLCRAALLFIHFKVQVLHRGIVE